MVVDGLRVARLAVGAGATLPCACVTSHALRRVGNKTRCQMPLWHRPQQSPSQLVQRDLGVVRRPSSVVTHPRPPVYHEEGRPMLQLHTKQESEGLAKKQIQPRGGAATGDPLPIL